MFLAVRGRPGEPEQKQGNDSLAACWVQWGGFGPPQAYSLRVRLLLVYHVSALFFDVGMFCWIWAWVPGGRQEVHPDAK